MTYWRSTSQFEVDLLLGRDVAIEIKATQNPSRKHLKGLLALAEENIFKHHILVYTGDQERKTPEGIQILPWQTFLTRLWDGAFV